MCQLLSKQHSVALKTGKVPPPHPPLFIWISWWKLHILAICWQPSVPGQKLANVFVFIQLLDIYIHIILSLSTSVFAHKLIYLLYIYIYIYTYSCLCIRSIRLRIHFKIGYFVNMIIRTSLWRYMVRIERSIGAVKTSRVTAIILRRYIVGVDAREHVRKHVRKHVR